MEEGGICLVPSTSPGPKTSTQTEKSARALKEALRILSRAYIGTTRATSSHLQLNHAKTIEDHPFQASLQALLRLETPSTRLQAEGQTDSSPAWPGVMLAMKTTWQWLGSRADSEQIHIED